MNNDLALDPRSRVLTCIYWLGGSPCAGKTALTNRLSARLQAHVYHCDNLIGPHLTRANPGLHPALYAATRCSWDALLSCTTPEYIDFILRVYQEEFEMVMDDLQQIASDSPGALIIAEGINLLPGLVAQVADPQRQIYLIATPEQYLTHQSLRPEFIERIKTCPDPQAAQESYIAKDLALAQHIDASCQALNLKSLRIGPENKIEENLEIVKNHFGL